MTVRITMWTPDGIAEAVAHEAIEGGYRWTIGYPTGDATFYGSKTEVKRVMRERIAQDYAAA